MRRKISLGLIVLVAFMGISLFTINANAASYWYTCTVAKAGPTGSNTVYIYLTDTAATPKFVNKAFTCLSGQENRQLAVAMAAMTNGQQVYVSVDYMISNVANRFVNAIFLLP
jgi:hypothetical protein